MQTHKLPELLAPAGSVSALTAAICGGADAVYLGGQLFNARIHAQNFSVEAMGEAFSLCHAHGVKVYVTLNTQIYDRELPALLAYVGTLYELGADALILADLGCASLIRQHFPDLPLHASTQCTVHNAGGAAFLAERGFSRVVCAREMSSRQIASLVRESPAEIEMFVHGAHCVSVSGQCLMSFALGGRSGNRGECAQPCRLPYTTDREGHPLSLKDMSLARHIPEICGMGVASLKIEGRMKSAEYVYGVTSVYRRLLDERRVPTKEEEQYLEGLFSRCGFTDGYFCGKTDRSMLGVRTEENKQQSREAASVPPLPKVPVKIFTRIRAGEPMLLTLTAPHGEATVYGEVPQTARNVSMTAADYGKNLGKFGNTPFTVSELTVDCAEGLMVPVSALNALRREAVTKLLSPERTHREVVYTPKAAKKDGRKTERMASFLFPDQITEAAKAYFDHIFLPPDRYDPRADGVEIPPVLYDNEKETAEALLRRAYERGARVALVSNVGHIEMAKRIGFRPVGSHRLNLFNGEHVRVFDGILDRVILSAELTLRQAKDFPSGCGLIVYGKLPLMLLHRCIIRDVPCGCDSCKTTLTDRTGAKFPVFGSFGHRCLIYNSVPIYMADRGAELDRAADLHFYLFTDESPEDCDRVIRAYQEGSPSAEKIRRIP